MNKRRMSAGPPRRPSPAPFRYDMGESARIAGRNGAASVLVRQGTWWWSSHTMARRLRGRIEREEDQKGFKQSLLPDRFDMASCFFEAEIVRVISPGQSLLPMSGVADSVKPLYANWRARASFQWFRAEP